MPRVQFVKLSVVVIITFVVALIGYGNIAGQAPTATPTGTAAATPTAGATGSPSPAATAPATALPSTAAASPAAQSTAAPPTATAVKPPATVLPPALASAQCTPAEVTVFAKSPRVEVKCAKATNGIILFDLPTSDSNLAQRVLTVLMTAVTDKKNLRITYDDNDTSGQALGCAKTDCRMIIEIALIS